MVDAAKGYVLTNQHVIAGATSVKVTIGSNESNARVLGQAPCEDLAVLEAVAQARGPQGGQARQRQLGGERRRGRGHGLSGSFEEEASERRLQGTDGTVSSGAAPARSATTCRSTRH